MVFDANDSRRVRFNQLNLYQATSHPTNFLATSNLDPRNLIAFFSRRYPFFVKNFGISDARGNLYQTSCR